MIKARLDPENLLVKQSLQNMLLVKTKCQLNMTKSHWNMCIAPCFAIYIRVHIFIASMPSISLAISIFLFDFPLHFGDTVTCRPSTMHSGRKWAFECQWQKYFVTLQNYLTFEISLINQN